VARGWFNLTRPEDSEFMIGTSGPGPSLGAPGPGQRTLKCHLHQVEVQCSYWYLKFKQVQRLSKPEFDRGSQ
jgi:hypothetical protein